jgi:hypothetical protein
MNGRVGANTGRGLWKPVASVLLISLGYFQLNCDGDGKDNGGTKAHLEAPTTNPPGPDMVIEPGEQASIRATSNGATEFEWSLGGDGKISSSSGPAVIYTAPGNATTAVLSVKARNDQGVSPETALTISVRPAASVGLDALAIPAGWMSGRGAPQPYISMSSRHGDCHSGGNCMQFTYRSGGGFGAICWWPQSCGASGTPQAFNSVRNGACGTNVLTAGGLKAVRRLTLWAKGSRGGEAIEFKVGAKDILPTPGRSLGTVNLTDVWTRYQINLDGVDMTNAIGLFFWVASDLDNPQGATFYLDEIKFEGTK